MWTEYVNSCVGRDLMIRTFCPQTGGTYMEEKKQIDFDEISIKNDIMMLRS